MEASPTMGTLVISLDVEFGWGLYHVEPLPVERVTAARAACKRVGDLFERLEVPVTWAFVGHLFLEECTDDHVGHPAGPRCCSTPSEQFEELWFGGEIVDRIHGSPVDHDVGAHGYTHVHFRHERTDEAFVERELRRTRRAAERRDVSPDSFVYPVNEVAHRDILADHGFRSYRGTRPTRLSAPRKLVSSSLNRWTPPLVTPTVDEHGLTNVPASMYLFSFQGPARALIERVRGDPVVNAAIRGLEAVAGTDDVLHLWFHPNNLTADRDYRRLRAIVDRAATMRDRGEIRIETMRDVAGRTPTGRGWHGP